MSEITLLQIAEYIGAEFDSAHDREVVGISTLHSAKEGEISFLDNPQYQKYLPDTKASAVILAKKYEEKSPVPCLVVSDPYFAYAKVSHLFNKLPKPTAGIHDSAVVDPTAKIDASATISANAVIAENVSIGKNVVVGPGCSIGADSSIDEETELFANVTLYHNVHIGKRSIIHSGVVLGADGFGMAKAEGRWNHVAQLGGVVIGDDVSIGANTSIDRGAIENTVIANGVKLDNLIQVGHNVKIGNHTVVAGCTAIAGSVTIGEHCIIAGGVCIAGHLEIADNITVTGMTGVHSSLTTPDVYSAGIPVQTHRKWMRTSGRYLKLTEMSKTLKNLVKQVEALTNKNKTENKE